MIKHSFLPIVRSCALLCLLYTATASVFYLAYSTTPIHYDSLTTVRLVIFLILAPIIIKYIIQLLALPFYSVVENSRERNRCVELNQSVSVLIPAWNEQVGILKTLKSILSSTYKNIELIVINDGSTDNTHQLITQFIEEYKSSTTCPISIKYLKLTNGGKARALNEALAISSGYYVMTIDADSVMYEDTISNIIRRFTDEDVAAVAGNVIVGNRKKPIELMQQLEYLYGFFFKRADSIFNSVYIVGGAAAAYRKDVLLEVGGFDEELITEDIEMSTRILAHGYKTRYAADAVVHTEGPSDLNGLFNQRLRWKYGRILTFIKHRRLFFSSKKIHHPYLTFLLLPLAVYAEITLLFEGVLLAIFYGYTIYANDYMPLIFVIIFISSIISLQIIYDSCSRFHSNLFILAPVAWLIFYIIDIVEFQALVRSLNKLWKRENLQWQKWVRVGLDNQSLSQPIISSDVELETASDSTMA
ncbi:MAG: biofilm PGA synthesis N-glycosyltransferase PgaC [Enterobacterales bacterium]|jgi:biofilm PGA synthesis N-glycosyltransferase PgaC